MSDRNPVLGYAGTDNKPTPALSLVRFIARQPIFDSARRVFAYELLSRSGWENSFRGDSNTASRVMLDSSLLFGIQVLANDRKAFLNCTRDILTSDLLTLLPPDLTVIEVLEDVEPGPEVIEACRELKNGGFALALDDFVHRPGIDPLVELADFIKVDFQASNREQRLEIHRQLSGSHARLLAEKVETEEDYRWALQHGYSHFQGYFFCRPAIISVGQVPPQRYNYVRVLAALSRSPVNFDELEQVIKIETSLCYRLFRLVNSAAYLAHCEVSSIRRALILAGEENLRKLVLIALAAENGSGGDLELVLSSLLRAKFCESFAPRLQICATELFLLGLFSIVDAILGIPMNTIVEMLPLRPELRHALLSHEGHLARPLRLLIDYEAGRWTKCMQAISAWDMEESDLTELYLGAVKWAEATMGEAKLADLG